MRPMKKMVRRSTSEAVADQLRSAIVTGDLPLGGTLSEASIASELGTSRTPVREAFRLLADEGLVLLRPYAGASVFKLTVEEVHDLGEFREVLEVAALRKAFNRNLPALVASLTTLIREMEQMVTSEKVRDYLILDARFHAAILEASGNLHLQSSYLRISSKVAAIRNIIGKDPARLHVSLAGHRAVFNFLRTENIEEATALLSQHLTNARNIIGTHIEGELTPTATPTESSNEITRLIVSRALLAERD